MDSPESGMPDYVAHTPNDAGRWQPLEEHLLAVAEKARAFAERFSAGELAYWTGLFHDFGKYTAEFQRYLRDCDRAKRDNRPPPRPGTAPHKQRGAAFIAQKLRCHPLAFIILGHHGQIPGQADVKAEVLSRPLASLDPLFGVASTDCAALASPPDLGALLRPVGSDKVALELLMRMVYSCLVDADSLDTERHTAREASEARSRRLPTIGELRDTLAWSQAALIAGARDTPVNRVRREVYTAAVAAADADPGVFRLTVPTGGGKTRTSLAFALEHAVRNGLERVIYAIPYTSIVDQTVEVFEGIFGAEAVLEHHSAIEPDDEDSEFDYWRRLACQNWDAPLVVTTTVQLFESLFGNRPGRSRKVHRLARAVIVLDEVQTLPPKLLKPLVDGLRSLADQYGSTILLCTATQPALDRETLDKVGFADAREIAPDPPRLFKELQRVTYDFGPLQETWTWEQVATAMRRQPQCLVVLNTRKDALAVLDALGDESALHLSTLLCGKHRRKALKEIRRRLDAEEPCLVVSTQVVECGCDLDFPLVLRASGPLDRIVQAAGRCNREGKRSPDESRVVVFKPADGGAPRGSYRVGIGVAERLLRGGADLREPAVYEQYFREAYALDDTDARRIQKLRGELDFPSVARKMRLIDDETVGVLVNYRRDEVEKLIVEARANGRRMNRDLWRKAQPHMVTIARWDFERFQKRGLLVEEIPCSGLWRWLGGYHPVRGLTEAERDPMDLIV